MDHANIARECIAMTEHDARSAVAPDAQRRCQGEQWDRDQRRQVAPARTQTQQRQPWQDKGDALRRV